MIPGRLPPPACREYIVLEDLEQFLDEKDAKAAMDMLDADGNGQVNVQVGWPKGSVLATKPLERDFLKRAGSKEAC